jgi:divalent metal cation (Fe/Co/Zn/Cd) transporter
MPLRCWSSRSSSPAAGAVAVAGAVIAFTGRFFWLDPALALVIAVIVAVPAAALCRRAVAALRGEDVDFDGDD